MNQICEREREIVNALRRGTLSAELREHTMHCEDCAQAAIVASFLQTEARALEAKAEIPATESVFWKARLDARREALKRATQPIAIMRNIATAAAAVIAVVFLLSGQLSRLVRLPSPPSALQSFLSGTAGMATLAGTAGIVACILVGSLYLTLSERR